MAKNNYKVLGVMSGTSLDGIDLAECFFVLSEEGIWNYRMGVAETIPYDEIWESRLREAVHFSKGRLATLDKEYTEYLGGIIRGFVDKNQITRLDAVCSHGHTILHQPEKGVTLQIGNLPEIAKWAGQKVVCDFRVQDVALGGQGAPLVPMGDRLLFGDYDYCLNLGGFGNCSFEKGEERMAYDICPVNIVLNRYAQQMGCPYDDRGALASEGVVQEDVLHQLNALEFYKQSAPKSLGLEWVQKRVFPILTASGSTPKDILATFTEHVAIQLESQFREGTSVLVTGGGAYNDFLLERIRFHKDVNMVVPEAQLLEFKEALVFGLLGVLKLRDKINCLASVTGASRDHSSGVVFMD
ncbi:MAG: anhydro-N-acetylmuramic acid kinase [Bacteroidota bacterium]